ncbi:hypothetical protein A7X58_03810 [Stenotrophomonas maltophilia]|nr:hypothetical protein A7X58_03810 [Stenotrophomonas maltophilia]
MDAHIAQRRMAFSHQFKNLSDSRICWQRSQVQPCRSAYRFQITMEGRVNAIQGTHWTLHLQQRCSIGQGLTHQLAS